MRLTRKQAALALIALLVCGLAVAFAVLRPPLIELEDMTPPLAASPSEEDEPSEPKPKAEPEAPSATEKPPKAEKPAEPEKPPAEPETPKETEKPPKPEPSETETPPVETETPKETDKPPKSEPTETQTPSAETETPKATENPGETEEPPQTEPPEEPETEDEPDPEEDEEPDAEDEQDETPEETPAPGPGSMQIGSRELASAAPGEALALAAPIRYRYDGRTYRSNAGASGGIRAYRAGHSASDYAQSIAEVLPWVRVSIAEAQGKGFPLEPDIRSQQRTLISDGVNTGYAVFEAAQVREDAEPGVHPVRLTIDWTDENGAQSQQALTAYIRITAGDAGESDDEPETIDEDDEQTEADGESAESDEDEPDEEDDDEEATEDGTGGDCRLLSVPRRLDFEMVTPSGKPQMIGLSGTMTIDVLDMRQAGGWTLRLTAEALTDGQNALPGTLVFVHADGRAETLRPGNSIVVAQKPPDAEPGVISLTWPSGEGMHVRLETREVVPGARYTAPVTWMLEVTDGAAEG